MMKTWTKQIRKYGVQNHDYFKSQFLMDKQCTIAIHFLLMVKSAIKRDSLDFHKLYEGSSVHYLCF